MDPALIYGGYLDFLSKAAVHAQIGQVEALLVEDRRSSLSPEDASRQGAEVIKVQVRAARRQTRLHERMLDGAAADLKAPMGVAYDADSRSWRVREPLQHLDSLGRAEIESGFTPVEGPYPDAGLPNRFRWTKARRAAFKVAADRGPTGSPCACGTPAPDRACLST